MATAAPDGWRYIAQRLDGRDISGEFLDFNLPLNGVSISEVLSGHNSLSATISPEVARLKGPDGRPILDEWATAIWAESPDGEIRGGGMLTHSSFSEGSWSLECLDLSGMLIDLPYTEARFFIKVDPMDLFREIWRYAQSIPGGNFGVTIAPGQSPVILGGTLVQRETFDTEAEPVVDPVPDPDVPPAPIEPPFTEPVPVWDPPPRYATNALWRFAGVQAMKAVNWKEDVVDAALGKWLNKDAAIEAGTWKGLTDKERTIKERTIDKIGLPPNPPNGTAPAVAATSVTTPAPVPPAVEPTGDAQPTPTEPAPEPEPPVEWEYDAYKLAWYKDHDLSSVVDDLSSDTPFDWLMTHSWVGGDIRHHIRVGYPKIGGRHYNLRFVVGENIAVMPTVERDSTDYANEVLVLGSGEGSAQVSGRAFRNGDGRARKVAVVVDSSISSDYYATTRAQAELAKRSNLDDISEIVLMDHPHAPLGSVSVGDEILIEGETGWVDINTWCRVVGRTFSPDNGNSVVLTVIQSNKLG